ncbi:YeiH family protein [Tessaracoccus antarcticus]|uniref:Putative sulfate exporter family transporter n=1 Tax=Tessaracoccus antarcticus TaxID=2479848 RepID=A0A3M0GG77_9ACTN|nr:putative sulfate exporter family transporter [Tessaracoccus antarcticus]RMB60139.1 putative sulfate exporter family transporter [Tessaracoccus antarcticus]
MSKAMKNEATGVEGVHAPTRLTALYPGLLLCIGGGAAAVLANQFVPTVSALLFAIVLGTIIGNMWRVPAVMAPGVAVAGKRILRVGIVLLGLQLVLGDLLELGLGMVAVAAVVVTVGIIGTVILGRAMGIPSQQRLLIACGFSICGAAAVAACDGVLEADDEDVATGIALVVLFGTIMIPVLPLLVAVMHLGPEMGGLWAGASIHEVAQVVAAAGVIGGGALKGAVIVKLTRVLMLAPVMAVLGIMQRRLSTGGTTIKRPPLVPLFVVGFLAMVAVASLHLLPTPALDAAKLLQTAFLAIAMFALGLGVRIKSLIKVGPKPLVLGAVSTVLVTGVALAGVTLAA